MKSSSKYFILVFILSFNQFSCTSNKTLFIFSKPEKAVYSLAQMYQNPDLYLSSLEEVSFDTNGTIYLKGIKHRDRNLSGNLINSVLNNIHSTEAYPECLIEHTAEEAQAYYAFNEEFKTRPQGSDGSLLVMDWHRNKFPQKITFQNINRNTNFASCLLKSDLYLKRMIMGKKRLKVWGMYSYVGYVEKMVIDRMEEGHNSSGSGFESIFHLVPDSICISTSRNQTYKVTKCKFKLVPHRQSNKNASKLETEWANSFNDNYNLLLSKHKELRKLSEVLELFTVLKLYTDDKSMARNLNPIQETNIPEQIESFKFSKQLIVPAPMINHPARISYRWIMISGGVSFDLSEAVIIEKEDPIADQ
ncbi:MAG: hypothetical protein ACLFQB_10720 [Chitinispirillaceae bacterium]